MVTHGLSKVYHLRHPPPVPCFTWPATTTASHPCRSLLSTRLPNERAARLRLYKLPWMRRSQLLLSSARHAIRRRSAARVRKAQVLPRMLALRGLPPQQALLRRIPELQVFHGSIQDQFADGTPRLGYVQTVVCVIPNGTDCSPASTPRWFQAFGSTGNRSTCVPPASRHNTVCRKMT